MYMMYEDNHKSFVGILFDEIKIQEDLVYDKHTGELIGYCDQDSIGNEILNLENLVGNCKKITTCKIYASDYDVPYLIKTARNCLCNSFSHKNTRRLWKNGKDISWMHIVRLFEEHCELQLYSPCPKLTWSHIDLAAFTYMKVNLAAQILSGSVANALEHLYDDRRNKRNPDLEPFTGGDDPRLNWLKSTFLDYLKEWKQSVMQRPNLTLSKKLSMQPETYKTKRTNSSRCKNQYKCFNRMCEIYVGPRSRFRINLQLQPGPPEQHFGHYRHKGGANNNPSVYEVRNTMTQLRAVGAQALNPKRGNITNVNKNENVIDNTKLPRTR
ncbi:THAP9 [Mytilus coruscus]|uniref:THAP9 n=1 Tax=Mytilus coruscus TaxID=42192 RepID=A0A6J8CPG1_MYTCO|nr:THAP9 [Mytilus coruscus]